MNLTTYNKAFVSAYRERKDQVCVVFYWPIRCCLQLLSRRQCKNLDGWWGRLFEIMRSFSSSKLELVLIKLRFFCFVTRVEIYKISVFVRWGRVQILYSHIKLWCFVSIFFKTYVGQSNRVTFSPFLKICWLSYGINNSFWVV